MVSCLPLLLLVVLLLLLVVMLMMLLVVLLLKVVSVVFTWGNTLGEATLPQGLKVGSNSGTFGQGTVAVDGSLDVVNFKGSHSQVSATTHTTLAVTLLHPGPPHSILATLTYTHTRLLPEGVKV